MSNTAVSRAVVQLEEHLQTRLLQRTTRRLSLTPEGAAYLLGFREALRQWRRLLRPFAHLVVSECTWLTESPPDDIATYWQQAYPAMATVAANVAAAADEGYRVLDTMLLPASDWWTGYYEPLSLRIAALRSESLVDPALDRIIGESESEMALFERGAEFFGYVFFVLQRTEQRGQRSLKA